MLADLARLSEAAMLYDLTKHVWAAAATGNAQDAVWWDDVKDDATGLATNS